MKTSQMNASGCSGKNNKSKDPVLPGSFFWELYLMPWNTTISPIDKERIRKALNFPAAKVAINQIQTAMDRISLESAESIATVQELLEQIEELTETIKTTRSDSSYSMIRADVVEWEPGGKRADGMVLEKNELTRELAATLSLEPYTLSSSNGVLLRS